MHSRFNGTGWNNQTENRACFKCVYSANSERGEAATFSGTKYDSMVDIVTKATECTFEKKYENISSIPEKLRNFSFERVFVTSQRLKWLQWMFCEVLRETKDEFNG